MKYKPEIKELLKWLENKENTMSQIAAHMGYKTTSTIGKWIKENSIPQRQVNAVLEFIRK